MLWKLKRQLFLENGEVRVEFTIGHVSLTWCQKQQRSSKSRYLTVKPLSYVVELWKERSSQLVRMWGYHVWPLISWSVGPYTIKLQILKHSWFHFQNGSLSWTHTQISKHLGLSSAYKSIIQESECRVLAKNLGGSFRSNTLPRS